MDRSVEREAPSSPVNVSPEESEISRKAGKRMRDKFFCCRFVGIIDLTPKKFWGQNHVGEN